MKDANILQVTKQQLVSGLGLAPGAVAWGVGGSLDGIMPGASTLHDSFTQAAPKVEDATV